MNADSDYTRSPICAAQKRQQREAARSETGDTTSSAGLGSGSTLKRKADAPSEGGC